MRILITGAAGYIGSVLCPALLAKGHSVIAVDNFRYHQYNALALCCAHHQFELINADATTQITYLINKADVIIPLAAIVGMPACKKLPDLAYATNVEAIKHITHYSSPDQLIIYPNTNSAYGTGGNTALDEDSEMKPLSGYAITKCEGEYEVLQRENSVVFRLATVFGISPRMRTDLMVNDFVLRATRDGGIILYEPNARRNFIHIRDVARAFLWAIEYGARWKQIYNLGHDESNCTKWELCDKIKKYIPNFAVMCSKGEDPDKRDYIISNQRLRQAGFEASLSLDDGIKELIKLYQAYPSTVWGNV